MIGFLVGIGMFFLLVVFLMSAIFVVYSKWVDRNARLERFDGPHREKQCGL